MHWNIQKAFLVAQLFLISGLEAKKSSTCTDLDREIKGQLDEIISLKLQLEKYKIADDSSEDVPDECNSLGTCFKCLRGKNTPGCGWCFFGNRCTLRENCPGSDRTPQLWMHTGVERCPKIRGVKPHLIPSVSATVLDVIIPYMPEYNKSLICSFELLGSAFFTKGSRTDKGVSCPSPRTDKILPFPQDSAHISVTLSVQQPNGPSFASTTNFTIFDCRRYSTCSECTSSPFPCAWCTTGNKCTHDVDEDCKNDIFILSKAVPIPSIRQGPTYCARILPNPSGSSNEILMPSGLQKRIRVKEENILHSQASTRFSCKVEGHPTVRGQLLGDIIYCDPIKFRVDHRKPISNLSFDVYWGGSVKMDNPQKLHVVVYDCSLASSSCGECLDLPPEYDCGWCDETNTCTMRDDCEESQWMDHKQTCTKPEILSFYPKSGLLNRPTNITIKGINFGKEFKDIADGVSLINEDSELIAECTPIEELYVKFSQIVCLLDVPEKLPENNGSMHGLFEVKVLNEYITVSGEEYYFVDPSITGLQPVKGIKSGGTYLTIVGDHLDAGNLVEAYVGDIPCRIISRDPAKIRCITSPSPRTRSSSVRVTFDGEERTSSSYFFYVEDPFVKSVRSEFNADGPVGTPSGGNLIIIQGENFDHVQNSFMYVIVDNEEYPGPCSVESPTEMKCLSPRVPADLLNFCGDDGIMAFDYGFRMGNAEDVQNISMSERFSKFHMYPDAFFKPFGDEDKIKLYKSEVLVIEGQRMDSVVSENDITIEIGVDECTLISLSYSQLVCRPPPTQPEAKDGDPNKLPEVVVKVRGEQEHFIGFLRYD